MEGTGVAEGRCRMEKRRNGEEVKSLDSPYLFPYHFRHATGSGGSVCPVMSRKA
jgi:hypothetical protein